MKNSIILALAVLLASVASVTLVSTSQFSVALTIEKNDSNSSNSNVTIVLTTPAAFMSDSQVAEIVCVDVGVSSFSPSSDANGLSTFSAIFT